jgi:hypothetical protein
MSKFSMIFTNKSPFKHGDGSGVSPATQEMLDTRREFSENRPPEGDYTQDQYDEYDAALEAHRARIEAGE